MQYLSTTLWWFAVAVLVVDLIHALTRSLRSVFKFREKIRETRWGAKEYKNLYKLLYLGQFSSIKPFIHFTLMTMFGTAILFVLNPVFLWPRSGIKAIIKWRTKRNYVPQLPPLVYTNMVNGILAVVRADNYERDKAWHQKAVVDGRVGQNDFVRVLPTFLFHHKAAKLGMKDMPLVSGWLSDFRSDVALKCRVEERKDIYVPLASPNKKKQEQDHKFLSEYGYDRRLVGIRNWIFREN